MRFGDDLPPTMVGFEREPADDELSMLACRRTTFEWVVRRAALAEGRVEFRTGVAVDGSASPTRREPARHPTSPACAWPTAASAPAISSSSPPGGAAPCRTGWATSAAAPIDEEVDDTGIVYFSRFYRLRRRRRLPAANRPHRRRPRIPQVRRVRRRQPHVLGHPGDADRRPGAAQAADRSRRVRLRVPANWSRPRRGSTAGPSRSPKRST